MVGHNPPSILQESEIERYIYMIFDYTEMGVNFYDLTARSKIEIQYTKTARSFDFPGFRGRGLNLMILEHLSNLEFQYIYIYTHTASIYTPREYISTLFARRI